MSGRAAFVSWQPLLTDHQAFTLAALRDLADGEMSTVAVQLTDPVRAAQGWTPMSLPELTPTILPERGWLQGITAILRSKRDATHLFCSPFGDFKITVALLLALRAGCRVYLISEPFSPIGAGYLGDRSAGVARLKALLRPGLYRIYGALIRRRVAGVFAISALAIRQYRAIGIPAERVHPFGYFVPGAASRDARPLPDTLGTLRLCFVGSLIARKGLPQLIAAVRAGPASISLDVFGAGDAASLDFDEDRVRYRGTLAFGTAPAVIAGYDALVVPSLHDGWGVVVNEAILSGVPVICSDRVGASVLVKKLRCGLVYDGDRPTALNDALVEFASDREHLLRTTAAAEAAHDVLAPQVAARYMLEIIRGGGRLQIVNPWYPADYANDPLAREPH